MDFSLYFFLGFLLLVTEGAETGRNLIANLVGVSLSGTKGFANGNKCQTVKV